MSDVISSFIVNKNNHGGIVMKLRLEPLDVKLEDTLYSGLTAWYLCEAYCLV